MEVTVNPGMTFRELTPELVRLGTVRDADAFRLLLRWMNYRQIPHSLKPGRFRLNTGWTPQQVIDQLVNGSPLLDRVTIPEGLTFMIPPSCVTGGFPSTPRRASCSRIPI